MFTVPDGRNFVLAGTREDISRSQFKAREVLVHLDGADGRGRVGGNIGTGEDRFHRSGFGLDLVLLLPLLHFVVTVAYLTLQYPDYYFVDFSVSVGFALIFRSSRHLRPRRANNI